MTSFASIHQRVQKHAEHRHLAIAGSRRSGDWCELSWEELNDEIYQIAVQVSSKTSSQGFFITKSDNTIDDVVEMLASLQIGFIHCPIDHRLSQQVREQRRRAILQSTPPAATSTILWTSGTSGRESFGRGVCLSAEGFWQNALAKLKRVPQSTKDVRLTVLPICHAYARTCDIGTWLLSGSTLVVGLGYEAIQRHANQYHATHINVVPSIAARMILEAVPQSLRVLGVGGAALPAEMFSRWRQCGVDIVQGYGLTETGPVICSADLDNGRPSTVGKVVDGWQTRVHNQSLSVRGPALMLGYLGGEKCFDEDGFFDTGDLVEVETDGQLKIVGRRDDRITLANAVTIDPLAIEQEFEGQFEIAAPVMLRVAADDSLTIWTNCQVAMTQWKSSRLGVSRPIKVTPFEPPLVANERNAKGGIRRQVIELNRFNDA